MAKTTFKKDDATKLIDAPTAELIEKLKEKGWEVSKPKKPSNKVKK